MDYVALPQGDILAAACCIYQPNQSVLYYSCENVPGLTTKEKSDKMLKQFFETLVCICTNSKIKYVYFDSLSSVTSIILVRAAILCHREFSPVIRDTKVHQIKILRRAPSKTHVMFILRDYSLLLNFSIQQLFSDFVAATTIPKARIVQEDCLKESHLELKQAQGVRVKALYEVLSITQSMIFEQFACDIVKTNSISSLAMKIFLTHYYQEDTISSNSEWNDAFIREAYFGGHADIYKPFGQNVYVFDVNSLYASCMQEPMPVGIPKWLSKCEDTPLSELFGFVEAVIECPKHIDRPFLPVRTQTQGVIYPTGSFQGVYFSEELIVAQKLGYKVSPLRALLFDRQPSPLKEFVENFYEKRLKAKLENKHAAQLLYKLISNSLYGRFGLRPDATITTVGSYADVCFYKDFYTLENVIELSPNVYMITYKQLLQVINKTKDPTVLARVKQEERRRVQKARFSNTAVNISAAVTAYGRIRMYPFISDENTLYSDTDSVMTTKPLPQSEISATKLGKFKCEAAGVQFCGLAPKLYALRFPDESYKVVKSGLGKEALDFDKIKALYGMITQDRCDQRFFTTTQVYHRGWDSLTPMQKNLTVSLQSPNAIGRIRIFDSQTGYWVATKPLHHEPEETGTTKKN